MSTSTERQDLATRRAAAPRATTGNVPTIVALLVPAGNDPAPAGEWPSRYELYLAARSHRAFVVGEIAATAVQAVSSFGRGLLARYRKRRRAAAARETLRELDDRTLHDIGLDRSEIESVTAEAMGDAEPSRAQVLRMRRASNARRT